MAAFAFSPQNLGPLFGGQPNPYAVHGLGWLFETCAAWTRETGGAFDIATGALIKAWGFYKREGRVPSPRERAQAMACTGMRHVILNAANRSGEPDRSAL